MMDYKDKSQHQQLISYRFIKTPNEITPINKIIHTVVFILGFVFSLVYIGLVIL